MSVRYNEDFKKEVVKAYVAGNKSTVQIAAEYNIAKALLANGLTSTTSTMLIFRSFAPLNINLSLYIMEAWKDG